MSPFAAVELLAGPPPAPTLEEILDGSTFGASTVGLDVLDAAVEPRQRHVPTVGQKPPFCDGMRPTARCNMEAARLNELQTRQYHGMPASRAWLINLAQHSPQESHRHRALLLLCLAAYAAYPGARFDAGESLPCFFNQAVGLLRLPPLATLAASLGYRWPTDAPTAGVLAGHYSVCISADEHLWLCTVPSGAVHRCTAWELSHPQRRRSLFDIKPLAPNSLATQAQAHMRLRRLYGPKFIGRFLHTETHCYAQRRAMVNFLPFAALPQTPTDVPSATAEPHVLEQLQRALQLADCPAGQLLLLAVRQLFIYAAALELAYLEKQLPTPLVVTPHNIWLYVGGFVPIHEAPDGLLTPEFLPPEATDVEHALFGTPTPAGTVWGLALAASSLLLAPQTPFWQPLANLSAAPMAQLLAPQAYFAKLRQKMPHMPDALQARFYRMYVWHRFYAAWYAHLARRANGQLASMALQSTLQTLEEPPWAPSFAGFFAALQQLSGESQVCQNYLQMLHPEASQRPSAQALNQHFRQVYTPWLEATALQSFWRHYLLQVRATAAHTYQAWDDLLAALQQPHLGCSELKS